MLEEVLMLMNFRKISLYYSTNLIFSMDEVKSMSYACFIWSYLYLLTLFLRLYTLLNNWSFFPIIHNFNKKEWFWMFLIFQHKPIKISFLLNRLKKFLIVKLLLKGDLNSIFYTTNQSWVYLESYKNCWFSCFLISNI